MIWSLFHFGTFQISDLVLLFSLPYSFSSLGHSREPESVNLFLGEHFSHFQTMIPDWLTSISSSDRSPGGGGQTSLTFTSSGFFCSSIQMGVWSFFGLESVVLFPLYL